MSETTETYVRSLLQTMGSEVDVIMANTQCSNRFLPRGFSFQSLSNRISLTYDIAAIVEVYAHQRLRVMRKALMQQYTVLTPEELKKKTTEFILWNLVSAHAMPLPTVLPKLHHWLPLCYTKRFASRLIPSSRAAIIQQVTFNKDGSVREHQSVRDTFFAHPKAEDGYYPARIEQFFSRVESRYSSLHLGRADKSAWTEVTAFAFFLIQSARNPNPEGKRFHRDHRANIISNIFSMLDAYERPYIQFARGCTNLWFSPFFPPRVRKTVAGITAAVFPMDPHMAMVVTDTEISDIEAHQIATRNAATMVRHAARVGKPLYGMIPN